MKVVILSFTGGVGKTSLAAHMLSPRMNGAQIIAIESINQTASDLGIQAEQLTGDQFRLLLKSLIICDDVIVDVGASNIESFLASLVKFEDSHTEFDMYLIPITKGSKEQKETIQLVRTLAGLGIPASKIQIIFNKVDVDVADEFLTFINFNEMEKLCTIKQEAAVFETELFNMLNMKRMGIAQVLEDETDYKQKAREALLAQDQREIQRCTDMHVIKSLAKSVHRNLNQVYHVLFT